MNATNIFDLDLTGAHFKSLPIKRAAKGDIS